MDREHATALDTTPTVGADLIDFSEVKRRPRKPRPEPTPDELLDEFRAAVRRTLLADLATWPAAFRRAVLPEIEWEPDPDVRLDRAAMLWQAFKWRRELGDADEGPSTLSGCGCGCRGFNGEVAEKIRKLRTAAQERRSTPRPRVNGYRHIGRAKAELLELMWYYGRRRIDRARLRQHVVESAAAECEEIKRGAAGRRERIAEYQGRLRDGIYLKGKRKRQPFDEKTRSEYAEGIRALRAAIVEDRARAAELRAQLADEAALVRRWTGCERVAAGVS